MRLVGDEMKHFQTMFLCRTQSGLQDQNHQDQNHDHDTYFKIITISIKMIMIMMHHNNHDDQDTGEPVSVWARWLAPFSPTLWLLLLLGLLATLLVLW